MKALRGSKNIGEGMDTIIARIAEENELSGVIDRLHFHRNAAGAVERVEIIDFKTDAVKTPDELNERYAGQMAAYRAALEKIHPGAAIECLLLSVRHGVLVPA
jgi:ATP-dependent exoDNAse (exonuclease V) beta subunit